MIKLFKYFVLCSFLACGFGRRASDGGANLQQKEKQQAPCEGGWSHPSSREQLSTVRRTVFHVLFVKLGKELVFLYLFCLLTNYIFSLFHF